MTFYFYYKFIEETRIDIFDINFMIDIILRVKTL